MTVRFANINCTHLERSCTNVADKVRYRRTGACESPVYNDTCKSVSGDFDAVFSSTLFTKYCLIISLELGNSLIS